MENVRFTDSFRFKLISITVIFILFPIISYSIIYSNLVKNIIIKKYSESAVQSVNEAARNIDFVLRDISEFSNVILTNRDFLRGLNDMAHADAVQFRNLLRSFFASRDGIDGIDVLVGGCFFSVGAIKVNENPDPRSVHILDDSEGQIVWINTRKEKIKILSGEFDKYYFSLGRKLIDINTLKELGMMMIDVDEASLVKLYDNLTDSEGGEVFISDRNGEILSHPDKNQIGKTVRDEMYAGKILTSQTRCGYVTFTDHNVKQIAIYSTCSVNEWKIVKIISNQYLYLEIEEIERNLIMTGGAYVLVTMFLALLFSLKSTEPMIRMMKLMKKAEQGNLNVRVSVDRQDEIGQLGKGFNNMIGEMRTLIDKLVEEERQKKEIELEALHAQINPHFLYNTLNSIKWMAKIQGAKSVSNAITALIKLLRTSINLSNDMILLREEIEYVKNYILIQKLRFNERFTVLYAVDDECLFCQIPKLILQPIVENSIIYSSSDENPERLKIEIKAFRNEERLLIAVSDNGPGIKPEVLKDIFQSGNDKNKFSTVGLNNVNQRIKLLCGETYGIKILTAENEGTTISIELPFICRNHEEVFDV